MCLSAHNQTQGAVDLAKALVQVTSTARDIIVSRSTLSRFHSVASPSPLCASSFKKAFPPAGCTAFTRRPHAPPPNHPSLNRRRCSCDLVQTLVDVCSRLPADARLSCLSSALKWNKVRCAPMRSRAGLKGRVSTTTQYFIFNAIMVFFIHSRRLPVRQFIILGRPLPALGRSTHPGRDTPVHRLFPAFRALRGR